MIWIALRAGRHAGGRRPARRPWPVPVRLAVIALILAAALHADWRVTLIVLGCAAFAVVPAVLAGAGRAQARRDAARERKAGLDALMRQYGSQDAARGKRP